MNLRTDTPAVPVPASTVILVTDHRGPLEVYLLKRSARSDFMPGLYVFPGGTVNRDDQDSDFWKTHIDMITEEVARRFGQGETGLGFGSALAHAVAAIRETFEEAGVLLARCPDPDSESVPAVWEQRLQGTLPPSWLRKWVGSGCGVVTLSALAPWSHWITPEAQPRRYDTRFFIAGMPVGQACMPDRRETLDGIWLTPEAALSGNLTGTIPLSPPTLVTLQELLPYPNRASLESEAGHRTWGEARLPRLVSMTGGAVLLLPRDPEYGNEAFLPDIHGLNVRRGISERPVSRLGYVNGLWLPLTP